MEKLRKFSLYLGEKYHFLKMGQKFHILGKYSTLPRRRNTIPVTATANATQCRYQNRRGVSKVKSKKGSTYKKTYILSRTFL